MKDHSNCASKTPFCFFTCGGTASGKTSAINLFMEISKTAGEPYLRIDYDRLKHCLPEYEVVRKVAPKLAAPYTHAESSKMAGKLFKKALRAKYNIIYEKTLADVEHTLEEIGKLRKQGYVVVVIATHLKEREGQIRAAKRFKAGGRYVPPEVIKESYEKVPHSLVKLKDLVDDLALLDNNATKLNLILLKDANGVSVIDETAYSTYLSTVGSNCGLI